MTLLCSLIRYRVKPCTERWPKEWRWKNWPYFVNIPTYTFSLYTIACIRNKTHNELKHINNVKKHVLYDTEFKSGPKQGGWAPLPIICSDSNDPKENPKWLIYWQLKISLNPFELADLLTITLNNQEILSISETLYFKNFNTSECGQSLGPLKWCHPCYDPYKNSTWTCSKITCEHVW